MSTEDVRARLAKNLGGGHFSVGVAQADLRALLDDHARLAEVAAEQIRRALLAPTASPTKEEP